MLEELPVALVPVPQMLPELLARSDAPGGATPGSDVPGSPASLFLVGEVDFGAPAQPLLAQAGTASRAAAVGQAALRFPPLPATAKELETVRALFQQTQPLGLVTDLRRAEATEAAFREQAPH